MKPERAPDVLDPREVVARYRRIVGLDEDLTEQLNSEPITFPVFLAGLGDFVLPVALAIQLDALAKPEGIELGSGGVGFSIALCAGLGFLIANSGDDYKMAGGRRISKPFGVLTGLILRGRMRRRRALRIEGPIHADDPKVLGPVARELAAPLLIRAQAILAPLGGAPPEDGDLGALARLGGDPTTLAEAAERIRASREDLRAGVTGVHDQIGNPSDRPALARALAHLDRAIRAAEAARDTGETIRQNLRRTFPFAPGIGTGSLEGPIRLNRAE